MTDSLARFDAGETARHIIGLYARALGCPPALLDAGPDPSAAVQIAA
jgi:hypothetical protein